MSLLYIAGSFDDNGGKKSKLADVLFQSLGVQGKCMNGGKFDELVDMLERINDYNLIFWFANVPNDKPKLIKEVKKRNKACILVTSKRNVEGKYSFEDLTYHALGLKSNLMVEFSKDGDKYQGRVLDPLGNVFLDYNQDFKRIGAVLGKRAQELSGFSRVASAQSGSALQVPDNQEFFRIIMQYADIFHDLVHAHPGAANRFFGNASFRTDDTIFVTRRNVDKRAINQDSFVGVQQNLPVAYAGDVKPSIDTPIQIQLYERYPDIRFMLHSHTYIRDAPFTERIVPCGALEEASEIFKIFDEKDMIRSFVNLRGHGSLALVNMVNDLKDIPYIPRTLPEVHAYD